MSQASNGGFRWSGSLQTTNIRALYERCQRLRLTGLMRLQQGDAALDLMWIGGEPIENEGEQGTRSLPIWKDGDFLVEQRMPDWKGQLTNGVEMSGSLRPGGTQAIYKLCAENVLSAEVELVRGSGESAQVRFTLGKAETASINGRTESALSALSTLSGWVDGNFRVVLRPLFGEGAAEAPVFKEKTTNSDEQFDVTGSVNVDITKGPVEWPAELRDAAGLGGPSPMDPPSASLKSGPSPAPAGGNAARAKAAPAVPPPAKPAGTPPPVATPAKPPLASPASLLPPISTSAPTVPLTAVPRAPLAPLANAPQKVAPRGGTLRTVGIAAFLLLLLCAGLAVGFFLVGKH